MDTATTHTAPVVGTQMPTSPMQKEIKVERFHIQEGNSTGGLTPKQLKGTELASLKRKAPGEREAAHYERHQENQDANHRVQKKSEPLLLVRRLEDENEAEVHRKNAEIRIIAETPPTPPTPKTPEKKANATEEQTETRRKIHHKKVVGTEQKDREYTPEETTPPKKHKRKSIRRITSSPIKAAPQQQSKAEQKGPPKVKSTVVKVEGKAHPRPHTTEDSNKVNYYFFHDRCADLLVNEMKVKVKIETASFCKH